MAKAPEQPDVSALKAAQQRLQELNVEESKILADILLQTIERLDVVLDRYADLSNFRPDAINQAINHRENCRILVEHLEQTTLSASAP